MTFFDKIVENKKVVFAVVSVMALAGGFKW
jgi:hypothetical protein